MSDVFSLLTSGGIKFDKKRFNEDINAFKPQLQPTPGAAFAPCKSKAKRDARSRQSLAEGPYSEEEGEHDIHIFGTEAQSSDEEAEGSGSGSEDAANDEPGTILPRDESCPSVRTHDYNEEANVIRKHYRIKLTGTDLPCPLRCFAELRTRFKSNPRLLSNLTDSGYSEPTPIQRQAIPALTGRRDLLAVAPTGSGKTLAFLVPIVAGIRALRSGYIAQQKAGKSGKQYEYPEGVKAVVLSPTHELASQQLRTLKLILPGTGLRCCLLSKSTAAGSDFSKVDILLANPLRLSNLVEGKKVSLSQTRYLILDEADKLFELGFMEQIDGVIAACTHKDIARALFSATLPEKVEELARSVLQLPLRITVGARNTASTSVTQSLKFVGRENGKLSALRQLLTSGIKPPVLVFVASK
eukprot:gene29666-5081_t